MGIMLEISHFRKNYGAVHEGDKALMEFFGWVLVETMNEMLKEWIDSRAKD